MRPAMAWASSAASRSAHTTTNSSPPVRAARSESRSTLVSRRVKCTSSSSPSGVAHGVVDELEAVEVDEEHGSARAGPFVTRERRPEMVEQQRPVRQAREGVVRGVVREPLLEGLAVGQVHHHAVEEESVVSRRPVRLAPFLDPAPRPVPVHDLVLDAVGGRRLRLNADDGVHPLAVVREDEVVVLEVPAEGLDGVSGEILDRIAQEDVAVRRPRFAAEHRPRDVVDEVGELQLGLVSLDLGVHAGRDVEDEALEMAGSVVAGDETTVLGEPADAAVAVADRVLDDERLAGGDRGVELVVGPLPVLGEDQVVEDDRSVEEHRGRVPGEILDRVAHELVGVRRGRPAPVDGAGKVDDEAAVPRLARPQRAGECLPLGVVADVHDDPVDVGIVEMAPGHELDRDPVAVGVTDAHRVRRLVRRVADRPKHLGGRELEVVRVHEVERVHPDEVVGRVPEELTTERPVADGRVAVDDDERVARVLDESTEPRRDRARALRLVATGERGADHVARDSQQLDVVRAPRAGPALDVEPEEPDGRPFPEHRHGQERAQLELRHGRTFVRPARVHGRGVVHDDRTLVEHERAPGREACRGDLDPRCVRERVWRRRPTVGPAHRRAVGGQPEHVAAIGARVGGQVVDGAVDRAVDVGVECVDEACHDPGEQLPADPTAVELEARLVVLGHLAHRQHEGTGGREVRASVGGGGEHLDGDVGAVEPAEAVSVEVAILLDPGHRVEREIEVVGVEPIEPVGADERPGPRTEHALDRRRRGEDHAVGGDEAETVDPRSSMSARVRGLPAGRAPATSLNPSL